MGERVKRAKQCLKCLKFNPLKAKQCQNCDLKFVSSKRSIWLTRIKYFLLNSVK